MQKNIEKAVEREGEREGGGDGLKRGTSKRKRQRESGNGREEAGGRRPTPKQRTKFKVGIEKKKCRWESKRVALC